MSRGELAWLRLSRTCGLKIQSSTDKCVFRYRQSNGRRSLQASDYCRGLFRCLNCPQRFEYRALGSSRKLDGSEKRICQLSFEF